MQFKSVLETEVQGQITSYLQEFDLTHLYEIQYEPILSEYSKVSAGLRIPDFLIIKEKFPFMIIEVVNNSRLVTTQKKYESQAPIFFNVLDIDYFIVTDSVVYRIYQSNDDFIIETDFNGFRRLFDQEATDEYIRAGQQQISETLSSIIFDNECFPDNTDAQTILKNFFQENDIVNNIAYNHNGRFFQFKANPELGLKGLEHQFFQALLLPVVDLEVCRYTTLESVFNLIKFNSYRMASDIAMNDRGEIDYVDKFIGIFYKPLNSLTMPELKDLNKNFISSCTTVAKQDNLTMYRLYGDDTKGVCLTFDLKENRLSNTMIVKRISYGTTRTNHWELEVIKKFVDTLLLPHKLRFRFNHLDVYKHFFKSSDYAIEDEVRLLYVENSGNVPDSQGWVISSPDSILSKFITFKLNNIQFPLKLNKIILGPNCPDNQINRRQLEVYLIENAMPSVNVDNSKIESYRKT